MQHYKLHKVTIYCREAVLNCVTVDKYCVYYVSHHMHHFYKLYSEL